MSKYLRCVGTDRDSVTGRYTFPDDPLSPFVKTEDAYRFLDEADKRIAQLEAEKAELLEALKKLYALVEGECPSLLDEDSDGDSRLDNEIRAAIAKAEGGSHDH